MIAAPMVRRAGESSADDELLATFLADRDEAAFERLVVRHGPMVLRVCRDVLGEFAAADDAFQATFLVFFRQAGAIRDRRAVGRWLYEVACRVARRARAGDSKRRAQERLAMTIEAVSMPDHDASDREWRPILHDEIQGLPARLRDAIVLCYLEGLTVEAAARQLDCPTGTLKSRLVKARDLLRARLTRRGLAASVIVLLMFSVAAPVEAAVSAPLLAATLRAALGGPGAVADRVEALARPEESPRRPAIFKLWVTLIVLLAALGGVRWSQATWAAAPPRDPAGAASVAGPAGSAWAAWTRWAGLAGDRPRSCSVAH